MRQIDILPPMLLQEPITIIGCGAIGSFTTLSLAKMGFENIQVFDPDGVEPENMNCQFFRHSDIGKAKADALASLIEDFTEVKIQSHTATYEKGIFPGVVISAVDNMATRRLIWEQHKDVGVNTRAIIDPRMGAESALLYTMVPTNLEDQKSYERVLYDDKDAQPERCTAKSTMYTVGMISGLVAKTVKDLLTNGRYPRVAQWGIKDNFFVAWPKAEVKSEIPNIVA